MSEASLPDEMKVRHPGIPWPKVAGMGNILRHEYEHIAHDGSWHFVHHDLRSLEKVHRDGLFAAQADERE